MKNIFVILLVVLAFQLTGCATISGDNKQQKQQSVQTMKNEVLTELYQLKPDTKSQISKASGYAVFSNVNVNLIFASFGGGYGLAKNNQTGKVTYMKMGEVGIGLGAGVKDFRVVFVFHSPNALNRFIEQGWSVGANADAAAKANEQGGAVGGEVIADNISIYQITKNGLALQATIKGTKYWPDDELN